MVGGMERRQRCQPDLDLVPTGRAEIPAVDADVQALAVAGHPTMRVPEQLHGAAVRPHPGPPGIVIQDDAASEAQLRQCAMARGLHPRER